MYNILFIVTMFLWLLAGFGGLYAGRANGPIYASPGAFSLLAWLAVLFLYLMSHGAHGLS